MNPKKRRRIYMMAGSKGGVGKTTAAISLVDYLRCAGESPIVVETDTSNQDVFKPCFKLKELKNVLLDLDDADGWIALINLLKDNPDRPVVINTASRNNDGVRKFGTLLDSTLDELESELVVFWMVNRQRDSLELLLQFRETVKNARMHVVRNLWFGPAAKFQLYEQSDIRREIEAAGGSTLDFPDLADRVADDLSNQRQPIEVAAKQFAIGCRVELQRWRGEVAKVFSTVLP